jgi:hypothetical protein
VLTGDRLSYRRSDAESHLSKMPTSRNHNRPPVAIEFSTKLIVLFE